MLKVYENQTVTFEALEAGDVFCWRFLDLSMKEYKIYFLVLGKGYFKLDGLQIETYNLTSKARQNFSPASLYSREKMEKKEEAEGIVWISKFNKREG